MTYEALYLSLSVIYLYLLYLKFFRIPAALWVSHYLADLLAVPLILYFTEKAVAFLYGGQELIKRWHRWVATLLVILCFEVFLPALSSRYTADLIDVLCYLIGLFFYLISIKLLRRESPK